MELLGFGFFELLFHVYQRGKTVNNRPQVGVETVKGVNRGHGGVIIDGIVILRSREKDGAGHGRAAE